MQSSGGAQIRKFGIQRLHFTFGFRSGLGVDGTKLQNENGQLQRIFGEQFIFDIHFACQTVHAKSNRLR